MVTKILSTKQRKELIERVESAFIAQMIEHRFQGPFVSSKEVLKRLEKRRK